MHMCNILGGSLFRFISSTENIQLFSLLFSSFRYKGDTIWELSIFSFSFGIFIFTLNIIYGASGTALKRYRYFRWILSERQRYNIPFLQVKKTEAREGK